MQFVQKFQFFVLGGMIFECIIYCSANCAFTQSEPVTHAVEKNTKPAQITASLIQGRVLKGKWTGFHLLLDLCPLCFSCCVKSQTSIRSPLCAMCVLPTLNAVRFVYKLPLQTNHHIWQTIRIYTGQSSSQVLNITITTRAVEIITFDIMIVTMPVCLPEF